MVFKGLEVRRKGFCENKISFINQGDKPNNVAHGKGPPKSAPPPQRNLSTNRKHTTSSLQRIQHLQLPCVGTSENLYIGSPLLLTVALEPILGTI